MDAEAPPIRHPGFHPAPLNRLPGEGSSPGQAFFLRTEDGLRLRLGLWQPEGEATGTVLLFPGRTEYLKKYAPVAARLAAEGLAVLAIDWRGQGMSDRLLPDPRAGHIRDFADYQTDVVEIVLAADALAIPMLVGLGVDELSVSARSIALVKARVRELGATLAALLS